MVRAKGDDDVIKVNLTEFPAAADKIASPVSIYDADNQQRFGRIRNAFIRVVNQAGGAEIARCNPFEYPSTETAMIFGKPYHQGAEWKFRATGQGYASGLRGIAQDFGVNAWSDLLMCQGGRALGAPSGSSSTTSTRSPTVR